MIKADLKTGDFEICPVNSFDIIKLSPCLPPAGPNVLQLNDAFAVFSSSKAAMIELDGTAKIIATNKNLPEINDEYPIFDRIGCFDDFLLLRAYQFKKHSDEFDYKLYLLKASKLIAATDIDEKAYFPNYIRQHE